MNASRQINPSDNGDGTACRCRELSPNPEHSDATAEMNELAREMAGAFGELLNSYREQAKLTVEEAAKRVSLNDPDDFERILNCSPEGVSWLDLYALGEKDAGLALERWEQIKEAAGKEIRSGFRAARVIEDSGGPMERARFGAVRAKLMEDWRPHTGTEQLLVDQLAQWQVLLWRWQEAMTAWTNCAISDSRRAKKGESYEMMRLSEAEALERATEKVEKIHRMYLRTLKALQELQRPRLPAAVGHAEQVNIGPVRISVDNLD
jgi:hypothetical protein